ncbi:hypothetical protein [Winogradskyella sp. R77965]|uniref:hypothetical protein n=1 Tax=Winogradskyella sp. R77965 TaxID=3093872 RepID=UPI0037DC16E6
MLKTSQILGGIIFGEEKEKSEDAEQELQAAQKERDASDNKAKAMFQQRIETADVQTLLNELSFKSQAAIKRLKDRRT